MKDGRGPRAGARRRLSLTAATAGALVARARASRALGALCSCVAWLGCGCDAQSPAADSAVDAAVDAAVVEAGSVARVDIECTATSCPELSIEGEMIAGAPFRGIGDPSLERDPSSSTLWLTYSTLAPAMEGAATLHTVGVSLARSDDDGRTFRKVQFVQPATRTMEGVRSFATQHEVSTLAMLGARSFVSWLDYTQEFVADGMNGRADIVLMFAAARSPDELNGASRQRWIRGALSGVDPAGQPLTAPVMPVRFSESIVPGRRCLLFTEPALFAHEGRLYAAVNCVAPAAPVEYSLELFELSQGGAEEGAPTWLGTLLSPEDARALGATSLEQADLSIARDGTILLIVTPVAAPLTCTGPMGHRGCVVLEVSELGSARVRRDGAHPHVRASITADALSSGPGPGLCTYDRASDTGVMLVTTTCRPAEGLTFTLRRTGFHP